MAPLPVSSYLDLKKGSRFESSFIGRAYEYYLLTLFAFYTAFTTARIVKKYDIEVILERETSFGAGALASRLTNTPMVLEVVGPRYSRYSLKLAKKILAYTKSMVRDPITPEKLELVTAAVNTELFRPDPEGRLVTRMMYGIQGSPVVGYVGTFAKWHGIDVLVEAGIQVLQRFPEASFLMVGPYFEHVQKEVQERGISHAFIFTGPIAYVDIPRYINAADVLVAPYDASKSALRRAYGIGSPLKVFEYMACGKPVIASSIEPITDVVEDGSTGILVPPGDPDALQNAITRLIEDPFLASEMGKMALETVKDSFSWGVFTSNLEQVLLGVLNHGKKA